MKIYKNQSTKDIPLKKLINVYKGDLKYIFLEISIISLTFMLEEKKH